MRAPGGVGGVGFRDHALAVDPGLDDGNPVSRIVLASPEVDGAANEVTFRWSVEPPHPLYRRTSFHLRFPEQVAVDAVPDRLWLTVLLLCLHSQWAFMRPCRIELPLALAPGEREAWLRLVDAAVVTVDVTRATRLGQSVHPTRAVEIVEPEPEGGSSKPTPVVDTGRSVAAFSGGKDSLTQLALLHELGASPIAVATTAPMPPHHDHETERRRAVFAAVPERRPIDVVEVHSDLRTAWDNDVPGRDGWWTSVSELADTYLYLASCVVVAWSIGAARIFLAGEHEVQANVERDGLVVQHPHFMYSAVSLGAASALLEPWGLRCCSLTAPLHSGQVQHLLWTRYADLADLQYSCWRVRPDQATCSACSQCLRIALAAMAAGGSPTAMGIDLAKLLPAMRDWSPSEPSGDGLPDDEVKATLHGQVVANVAAVSTWDVARQLGRHPRRWLDPQVRAALSDYRALRRRLLAGGPVPPAPGYERAYLDLVDGSVRDGMGRICDDAFSAADPAGSAAALVRTKSLVAWITAPLGRP
ncbi:MAG TPA: hypothetical protein VGM93_00445 [Acidimicrobiales bacterium]